MYNNIYIIIAIQYIYIMYNNIYIMIYSLSYKIWTGNPK